jgi:hypothetical protein
MTDGAVLSRFLRQAAFWWGQKAYGSRTAELAARKDVADTLALMPERLPDRYERVRSAVVDALASPCDPDRHVALSDALNAYWIAAARQRPARAAESAVPATDLWYVQ